MKAAKLCATDTEWERESEKLLQIIQTTPDYHEALDIIERARSLIIRDKARAVREHNHRDDQAYAATLTRLNHEKKRINIILDEIQWRDCIKAVLGQESLDAVVAYRREFYRDERKM